MFLTDKFGRRISDLRISITDRCNYKCVYCRSGNDGPQFPEMPIADYLRMARVFVGLGITKVRLTGGEPLLRKGLVEMVRELGRMRTVEGEPLDIAITTNGHLLAEMAQPLADAGLSPRHGLDGRGRSRRASRASRACRTATSACWPEFAPRRRAGLNPVKINCVLLRGFNDDQITAFGRFAREEGVVVRFIEFMPLEEDRVWSPEIVVTLDEIVRRMAEFMPLREIGHARSETARRYVFEDGVGEIGIIAPVSHPFCGHCSRVRVTSDGKIRTCLFSVREHDLAALMAGRRQRRRDGRLHPSRRRSQGRAPPHRRAGLRSGVEDDGAHRGVVRHPAHSR